MRAGSAGVAAELDLGAVGRALLRKRMWVIGPTLTAAVLSVAAVTVMTPRYTSEARVLVDGRQNVFLRAEADKLAERERLDPEAVASQVQLVLSRDLARKVIADLKLGARAEFNPVRRGGSLVGRVLGLAGLTREPQQMTTDERVLEAYYARLTAFPVDKSRVIAIAFSSADPALAASAANTIAETYLALQQVAQQEQTRAASQWLGGEIAALRQRVAEAEAKVAAFRAKSNLFVGANNTTLATQGLAELNSQLALARAHQADAEAKAGLIRRRLTSGEPVEFADIINSELIRRLAEQGALLRAQLAEQSTTLLANHPRIKELKAQIADLDGQIRREAEKLGRALENDARVAGARVDSLNAGLDQLKGQAAASGAQDIELRALEREAKAQRDLLEPYLAKYREASARDSLAAAPAEARIISRAIVAMSPAFPKKLPIVLIATLATLMLAVAFITTGELVAASGYPAATIAYEPKTSVAAEPAVHGPSRLSKPPAEQALAAEPDTPAGREPAAEQEPDEAPWLELMSEVPWVTPIADIAKQILAAHGPASVPGQALAGRCITVIGAARRIGTTAAAIALARALAHEGRAVLVDLALEAPSLAAISTEPNAPGVAELIRGAASFRHIITHDRSSGVHVIAAGRVPADTRAVLYAQRLTIGITALSRTYDHVVIDAGALSATAPESLARLSSHAVLVAPGIASDMVVAARDRLLTAGFVEVTVFAGTSPRPKADAEARTQAA